METCGCFSRFAYLVRPLAGLNTKSSPSRSIQTGVSCGRPLESTVATLAITGRRIRVRALLLSFVAMDALLGCIRRTRGSDGNFRIRESDSGALACNTRGPFEAQPLNQVRDS